jgi:catechol 2,3-dioxygenase-like lactoylglutathione lyase family enzyme
VLEYTGIRVRDIARSKSIYVGVLGLKSRGSGRMPAGGVWEELEDPQSHQKLELNFYPSEPPYREGDELDHLGFLVADLNATVAALEAKGCRVRIPAFIAGRYRLAFLSDPDGIWIEVQERLGEDEPPASRAGE